MMASQDSTTYSGANFVGVSTSGRGLTLKALFHSIDSATLPSLSRILCSLSAAGTGMIQWMTFSSTTSFQNFGLTFAELKE
jgi:hypothetical protein